jgi:hypothetical protein
VLTKLFHAAVNAIYVATRRDDGGKEEENVAQVKESVPRDEKSQVLGGRLSKV